jgi:hypothetical protein
MSRTSTENGSRLPRRPPRAPGALVVAVAACALAAFPAAAQTAVGDHHSVQRGSLTFVGTELLIHVDTDMAGEIRLVRGGLGRVQVVARAPGGMVAFGLENGGSGRLNLTALGSDRVSYLVVVPTRTRIRVRLPDDPLARGVHSRVPSVTLAWEATAERSGG